MSKGMLIILSGPSGVGKGTVRSRIISDDPDRFKYSISMTTRDKREGETDGKDYFFVSKNEFENKIAEGKLLEHAKFVDNYYGTPTDYVDDLLDQGHDVLLEIETNGAMQVKKKRPDGIFIFLLPPSMDELKRRIVGRATEDPATVEKRFAQAKEEVKLVTEYDYAIVNNNVNEAAEVFNSIIESESHRVKRMFEEQTNDNLSIH